jgi:dihydrofolate reductase
MKITNPFYINCLTFSSIKEAVFKAKELFPEKKVYLAGGAEIYKEALDTPEIIDKIHISVMKTDFLCDSFLCLFCFFNNQTSLFNIFPNPIHTFTFR